MIAPSSRKAVDSGGVSKRTTLAGFFRCRLMVVDIGASHVACAQFSRSLRGGLVLRGFQTEARDPDPALDAQFAEQVASSLRKISTTSDLCGRVSLAIPAHLALTKLITIPAVAKSKREKIIRFEASQSIPYPLEEVVWDHLVLANAGKDIEVLLAAVKTDMLQSLGAAVRTANLEIEHATPASSALHRAFRFNCPEINDCVLLVHVGARTTQVMAVQRERFWVRTVPLAGNTITQAIADGLSISFGDAEILKVDVLSGRTDFSVEERRSRLVRESAENFRTRLLAEIVRSSSSLRRQAGCEPTVLFLSGAGAHLMDLPELLARGLTLPVKSLNALRRLRVAAGATSSGADLSELPVELIGLAAALLEARPRIDLLPSAEKKFFAFRRSQWAWLAAAGLLLASLFPPLRHYRQLESDMKAELAVVTRQLEPLRRAERQRAETRAQLVEARSRLASLERVVASRTDWTAFLADLQRRLTDVGDVWLDQLAMLPAEVREPAGVGGTIANFPLQIRLSGRLLDRANPTSRVSDVSYARVKNLLRGFADSDFVAAISDEHFDNSTSGILHFDVTLTMRSPESF